MLLVTYNLLSSQNIVTYQSITVKNGWLQGSKKGAAVAQKKTARNGSW